MKTDINIVVIDDKLPDNDPLMVKLRMEYKNVVLIKSPTKGLEYLQENLLAKNIVLLDYDFGNEANGVWLLNEIRKLTSLLQIIVLTEDLGKIRNEEFAQIVDKQVFAFISRRKDYNLILSKVKEAELNIKNDIESAIEEWIVVQEKEKREKPYLVTAYGNEYTLNDILENIRKKTEFGLEFIKDFYALVIHQLIRKKYQIEKTV